MQVGESKKERRDDFTLERTNVLHIRCKLQCAEDRARIRSLCLIELSSDRRATSDSRGDI